MVFLSLNDGDFKPIIPGKITANSISFTVPNLDAGSAVKMFFTATDNEKTGFQTGSTFC